MARAAFLASVLALTACGSSDPLWSTMSGEPGSTMAQISQAPLSPPPSGFGGAASPAATPAAVPATYVGRKAQELRSDLARLQALIGDRQQALGLIRAGTVENSQRYYATVAAMSAKLRTGTTPGNPILTDQWNLAQQELDKVNEDIARLNRLTTLISTDASFAAYVLEATKAAFALSGAVDEDHRQLAILQDDVNRSVVAIDRLMAEVGDDVNRQTAYVTAERRNLHTLAVAIKSGEMYSSAGGRPALQSTGGLLGGGAPAPMLGGAPGYGAAAPALGDRPLVTIKFDRPNVPYQQALQNAVGQALDRRPDARFDVVGVAPNRGSAGQLAIASGNARRNAEAVLRSLGDIGLPANRVSLTTTTSPLVDSNEVQVFVR